MKVNDFEYNLPKDLIAQSPIKQRSDSRLLVLNKNNGKIKHQKFLNILDYFEAGDVLVLNDTKVIPARLIGQKEETEAVIEILLLSEIKKDLWEALLKPAKRIKNGTRIIFAGGKLIAECILKKEDGLCELKLIYDGILYEILDELGTMPLPPYITEKLKDKDRYQTIYAKNPGSAAAPTAGLHFTEDILKELEKKEVKIVYLTLHVGLATFRPLLVEDIDKHKMHSEYYELSSAAANTINEAISNNKRLTVVGTTSVRVLETVMNKYSKLQADKGFSDIFIYPSYEFKIVKNLITNFHLPASTLIMLVSALASRENIMNAYEEAIKEKYRFFSFGDAMLIRDGAEDE